MFCKSNLPFGTNKSYLISNLIENRLTHTHTFAHIHTHTPLVSLTDFVDSVDVCVAGDELLHHALHCQAGGQDEGRGAVVHAGIQVSGTVTDQDLEGEASQREMKYFGHC